MKRKILSLSILMMITTVVLIVGCKKSNPAPLDLGTLMVGAIDLNAASAPTNVPVNPTITATFTTAVDVTTATTSNVTLTEDYDAVSIPLTVTASGKVVTITPTASLANGALYELVITTGLKATDGQPLTAINRSFTTLGSFLPAGVFAYWNFDGNTNDQTGNYNAATNGVTDITYVTGRNAASGQAASFNGTTSLIEIPNGDVIENSSDFSISFWMKDDTTGGTSAKHDQFVLGLAGWYGFQFEYNSNIYGTGATAQIGQCKLAAQYSISGGTSASQDLWLDGQGGTKDNGSWQGWTFSKNLVANGGTGVNGLLAQQWAHIVCTYDHTTKIGTMYINGQEMKAQDFNLYPAPLLNATGLKFAGNAANNSFVFGFIQDKVSPTIPDTWADETNPANGHFHGLLDDVAIYHSVLTPALITLMYNSGKP
ncbi:MAG: Ig-like domain-containing protein [Bacteroidales bacterium]